MEIKGSTFLITGGGSGLGLATAQILAESGGNVALLDVNEATGKKSAEGIGKQAIFVKADVTDSDSVQAAIAATRQAFGAIHGADQLRRHRLGAEDGVEERAARPGVVPARAQRQPDRHLQRDPPGGGGDGRTRGAEAAASAA